MNENTPRSSALLEKVFDRLEKVDLEKLDMREIKDFLEVVQQGQFLESAGKAPTHFPYVPAMPFPGCKHPDTSKGPSETPVPAEAE